MAMVMMTTMARGKREAEQQYARKTIIARRLVFASKTQVSGEASCLLWADIAGKPPLARRQQNRWLRSARVLARAARRDSPLSHLDRRDPQPGHFPRASYANERCMQSPGMWPADPALAKPPLSHANK